MSVYFADTSAFAKRYIAEVGSKWIKAEFKPSSQNRIYVVELGIVEFMSSLARRQRDKSVSPHDFTLMKRNFLFHVANQYRLVMLDSTLLHEARLLVEKHPLRTLDALQLAAALRIVRVIGVTPLFLSADQRLLAIAQLEGFKVDNPNHHP